MPRIRGLSGFQTREIDMRLLLVGAVVAVCAVLAGCAAQQRPVDKETVDPKAAEKAGTGLAALREASEKARIREYPKISKERLLAAGEKALQASDSKYKITQRAKDGFYAERHWVFKDQSVTLTGKNSWKITAANKTGGSVIEVREWPGEETSLEDEYAVAPSLYNLFFARVDYFLGLRSDWAGCEAAKQNMYPYEEAGHGLAVFCGLAVDERDPTKAKKNK